MRVTQDQSARYAAPTAGYTHRELVRLRDDLRAAVDRGGHVLSALEFRRLARIVAELEARIAGHEATLAGAGWR